MHSEPSAPVIAIEAASAPLRTKQSNYPEPFFSRMGRREKRPLGDMFGLKNFGVNLTTIHPGGELALLHRHSKQDEFVYILQGEPTLVTDRGETKLSPGMCAGFPAQGIAHQLVIFEPATSSCTLRSATVRRATKQLTWQAQTVRAHRLACQTATAMLAETAPVTSGSAHCGGKCEPCAKVSPMNVATAAIVACR